jgi:hypothetical protein
MCIIILKGFASIFLCKEIDMERSYKCGDVIEYLGVRYYVVQDTGEDWLCINGHTFNACLLPKTKLSKFIGESRIGFERLIWIDFSGDGNGN